MHVYSETSKICLHAALSIPKSIQVEYKLFNSKGHFKHVLAPEFENKTLYTILCTYFP